MRNIQVSKSEGRIFISFSIGAQNIKIHQEMQKL